MQRVSSSRPALCVLVTKLDQVRPMMSDEDGSYIDAIGDVAPDGPENDGGLLLKWLRAGNGQAEQQLAAFINARTPLPVFFVWAEGMGANQVLPRGAGMTRFVEWCLKVSVFNPVS